MALTQVSTDGVKNDAITKTKIPANQIEASELADNAVDTNAITDDAVTVSKIQNVAQDRILGRQSSGSGDLQELNPGNVRLMINVADGANQTTISGNADNRVITGSDTANTLNAEAGFTHNPATDDTQIITSNNSNVADLLIQHTGGGAAAVARLTLHAGSNANSGCQLGLIVGSHSWYLETPKNAGNLNFMKGSQKFRMGDDGDFTINDGDLVIGTAGHGINFDGFGAGGVSNLLDDYEEGTFTPLLSDNISSGSATSYSNQSGHYTKIGNIVHIIGAIRASDHSNLNQSNNLCIRGLPFVASDVTSGSGEPDMLHIPFINNLSSQSDRGLVYGRIENGVAAAQLGHPGNTGQSAGNLTFNEISATNTFFSFSATYRTGS